MQKKITYIISNVNKALAFEWIATQLNKEKFALSFILLNKERTELETFLRSKEIPVTHVPYRGKKDLMKSVLRVASLLKKNKPDIVHTHLFDASLIGLLAAKLSGISSRIHTRHHSSYHHVYFPHMVKYDRLVNFLSTDIIAISNTVKKILVNDEKVNPKKVHLVYHGFELSDFENVSEEAIHALRKKINPGNLHPVIGVISRYTEWKGIQYIIPAFVKLLRSYPEALLVLTNTDGDYKREIKELLKTMPAKNYIEIPFENNIFALYRTFDIFVHTPIDDASEAFGQIYVEALASGIASVFTLSGIANELIVDRQNALVVPYKNPEAIHAALKELLEDKSLAKMLITHGIKDVKEEFQLAKMILSLESIYE
jgi:glycosyltransferase involved in cell wall biosynthesis